MATQPVIDQQDPFAWVDEVRHFGGTHYETQHHDDSYFRQKVASKDEHIDYLHDKLDYNRKFRRLWRALALIEAVALSVAAYQWLSAGICASL